MRAPYIHQVLLLLVLQSLLLNRVEARFREKIDLPHAAREHSTRPFLLRLFCLRTIISAIFCRKRHSRGGNERSCSAYTTTQAHLVKASSLGIPKTAAVPNKYCCAEFCTECRKNIHVAAVVHDYVMYERVQTYILTQAFLFGRVCVLH